MLCFLPSQNSLLSHPITLLRLLKVIRSLGLPTPGLSTFAEKFKCTDKPSGSTRGQQAIYLILFSNSLFLSNSGEHRLDTSRQPDQPNITEVPSQRRSSWGRCLCGGRGANACAGAGGGQEDLSLEACPQVTCWSVWLPFTSLFSFLFLLFSFSFLLFASFIYNLPIFFFTSYSLTLLSFIPSFLLSFP